MRGECKIFIGGQERELKIGMRALRHFSSLNTGSPVDFATKFERDQLGSMVEMVYCGLMARAEVNNLPKNFTVDTVCDWYDDLTPEDAKTILDTIQEGALNVAKLMGGVVINPPENQQTD